VLGNGQDFVSCADADSVAFAGEQEQRVVEMGFAASGCEPVVVATGWVVVELAGFEFGCECCFLVVEAQREGPDSSG